MFLFLRHGALLTIVETKAQYEDALASEYVPFFQTKDAAYARAFYHAWHALSSLIADGRDRRRNAAIGYALRVTFPSTAKQGICRCFFAGAKALVQRSQGSA